MASDRIMEMLTLAQSKSVAARTRLFENITDMFLSDDGRLTDHERALMSDILAKLISQVEKDVRKELSESLLRGQVDLPEIVNLLANDEIEIARPLLESSDLLKDPDLIEIVRMRTDEHRLSITMREELSEQLTDALVEYGDEDVVESLLNNHDAQLSKRAMEYLVIESRRVDRFQEPLVQRSDLPGDLAYKMYWWVSAALRKKIISDFDVDPIVLEESMKRATLTVMSDVEEETNAYVKAQRLVRRMHENGELTSQFLISAFKQQRVAVFVAGLAQLGSIDFQTAWRVFSDKGGESFAVLCRAIDLDRAQFTSMYLVIVQAREGGSRAKSPGVIKEVLDLFDRISVQSAKGALQVWQRESSYQQAIEELDKVS
ncbi:DUF2336 domain-containing protein [Temperatibacter marinus]|uniref:DUF2336 domain-containing protein n=1 Tax=Temperatibacter marinus TaxID=1456591 RepID=A0AA52EBV2_9PROT|nr:DUF2336 domain-containing protein [Temperatibacter marinus]WND02492.1 DUF2336 domain-containing protein [Temperatibacter marinus]